jgi:hypothetical protein
MRDHDQVAGTRDAREFPFRFDPRFRRVLRLAGITEATAHVRVAGRLLEARFGRWLVQSTLSNIAGTEVSGPYSAVKAIGVRLSVADRGLTFGSNAGRGLCIRFREPVAGIEPFGLIRHPGLTVTVTAPEELAAALRLDDPADPEG